MTTYAVYRTSTGDLVSVGSVVADPLPDDLTALALSDFDADLLTHGGVWEAETLKVVAAPIVDPGPSTADLLELSAAHMERSIIASVRDAAVELRKAAEAMRGET
jgi:hypothetical protein